MEHTIYDYALCVSIALMVFFGAYFILGKVPQKVRFNTYRRSRVVMGVALMTLTANYCVHLFVQPRSWSPEFAIFMNLSTYYLEAWLFSAALITLLDKEYLTRRLFGQHIIGWMVFTAVSGTALMLLPSKTFRWAMLLVMAACFCAYAFCLARRLFRVYRRAVKAFDDYHSEHIALYIRWMSIFTYWAVVFGVAVGMLTFLPERYIYLWILSAIPFYVYLFCSYMNYMLFCEEVDDILAESAQKIEVEVNQEKKNDSMQSALYAELTRKIARWLEQQGFKQQGLTIVQLADELHTNRTYLCNFIQKNYEVSFRLWINGLRIEYAKQMLIDDPEVPISEVARSCGYISASHFTAVFSGSQLCSPAKWRKVHNL